MRRAVVCLVGAVAVHGAVAIAIARARAPARAVEAASVDDTEIDVVAETNEPTSAEPTTASTAAPIAASTAVASNVKVNSVSVSETAGGGGNPGESMPPASSA
ncbi:MAG TPA: hypothetical protein VIF62_38985, partial [Labilithrix sp.]